MPAIPRPESRVVRPTLQDETTELWRCAAYPPVSSKLAPDEKKRTNSFVWLQLEAASKR